MEFDLKVSNIVILHLAIWELRLGEAKLPKHMASVSVYSISHVRGIPEAC